MCEGVEVLGGPGGQVLGDQGCAAGEVKVRNLVRGSMTSLDSAATVGRRLACLWIGEGFATVLDEFL